MNPFLAQLVACARVTAAGAATMARGCAVAFPGGVGTGIYTLTMPVGVDTANVVVQVASETADVVFTAVPTSDTVITITGRSVAAAPAAADGGFMATVWRV